MSDSSHFANRVNDVRCAVVTVSDTRTVESDTSGKLLRDLSEAAGHRVTSYEIVPDDVTRIRDVVRSLCASGDCDVVLLTGGTGIAPRDVTYEAITDVLEKRLDGFGELFRMLSFHEIGPAAMLSRAIAGTLGQTAIFAMPGSTAAVALAMQRLILPRLGHIVALLKG